MGVVLFCKTNRRTGNFCRTGIGGHHNNDISKISLSTIVVCQCAVIHHLKKDIEHIRVCFFDLVQQKYCMWCFVDCFGQQTTLIKTDVTRRCANQSRYGMSFHVFRHVIADQFNSKSYRELTGDFSLPHAGWPAKQV